MRTYSTIAGLFFAFGCSASLAQDIPGNAPGCAVAEPPREAGEAIPHRTPMKFFPRAKDIPPVYTGCQKVWIVFRGKWISFSTRYFENGEIKIFLGPLVEGQNQSRCVFENRTLVPSTSKRACPSFGEANTPAPSAPSGCIAELQSSKPSNRCTRYQ